MKASTNAVPNEIAAPALLQNEPRIWATSSKFQRYDSRRLDNLPSAVYPRALCSDRKGMLDQFKPRAMAISTVRVAMTAGSQVLAHYVTDQLDWEVKREELVISGDLTPEEADRQNDDWNKKEWSSRWAAYPEKALHALGRFHAVTFLMRVTEWYLSHKVTDEVLDRLTRDTFKAAVRENERGLKGQELRKEMWHVCLWANMIAFGCECAVSLCLLVCTYACQPGTARIRMQRVQKKQSESCGGQDKIDNDSKEQETSNVGAPGSMSVSLLLRSSKLVTSRFLGLIVASAGGAIGSQIYPGWGTLFGTSCGDGIAGALFDS